MCLHGDRNGPGPQQLRQGLHKLQGESLLELEAPRKDLEEAGELGEAQNPSLRVVSHMRRSRKWEQVMLTKGVEGDVPHGDEVSRPFHLEDAVADDAKRIAHMAAAGELAPGFGGSVRRSEQLRTTCLSIAQGREELPEGRLSIRPSSCLQGLTRSVASGRLGGEARPRGNRRPSRCLLRLWRWQHHRSAVPGALARPLEDGDL
mmetsp:Transcript_114985/g.256779  ORF Transcript_114985/g.256779 Transcript_114985/m.256779 type:complete len:204 (-) Transcript_114985:555-1166(-)